MNMRKFLGEFKAFAMRGNVIDLAVAVVIGTAFGRITTSLVNNIIMPLFGGLMGGIDFSNKSVSVRDAEVTYGVFIQSIIEFIIIALAIFIVIKIMAKLHAKEEKEEEKPNEEKPKEPSEEVKLLQEIRDSLQKKSDA